MKKDILRLVPLIPAAAGFYTAYSVDKALQDNYAEAINNAESAFTHSVGVEGLISANIITEELSSEGQTVFYYHPETIDKQPETSGYIDMSSEKTIFEDADKAYTNTYQTKKAEPVEIFGHRVSRGKADKIVQLSVITFGASAILTALTTSGALFPRRITRDPNPSYPTG